MYFAMVPYGWAVSNDSAVSALTSARRHAGRSAAESRKDPMFVLEFPDGTDVTVTSMGGWYADQRPVAVAIKKNINASDDEILGVMI